MKLYGLDQVTSYIDSTTLKTFPQSLLIIGKEGSGKRTISEYIAYHLNLNLVDMTDSIDDEKIAEIYRNPIPQIYRIDLRDFSEKKQNIVLKFFEEPGNAFVIMLANNRSQILNTVLTRALVLDIPEYSDKCLLEIAKDNNIEIKEDYIKFIKTPGDVFKLYSNNIDVEAINELTDKVITKINKASFPNMLTIVNKINFKDEYDKVDLDMFLKMLYMKAADEYSESKDPTIYKMSQLINSTIKKISFDSRLNKKNIVTDMLINLWTIARE